MRRPAWRARSPSRRWRRPEVLAQEDGARGGPHVTEEGGEEGPGWTTASMEQGERGESAQEAPTRPAGREETPGEAGEEAVGEDSAG